jgi:hypothetical protein
MLKILKSSQDSGTEPVIPLRSRNPEGGSPESSGSERKSEVYSKACFDYVTVELKLTVSLVLNHTTSSRLDSMKTFMLDKYSTAGRKNTTNTSPTSRKVKEKKPPSI